MAVLLVLGLLWASEEAATSKNMEVMMKFKDEGFVNVRGERRGYLSNQGVLKQRIKLFKDQEYLAVVGGDDDVEDLFLVIRDRKGNELLRSEKTKGKASITYVPPKKDKYYFVVEAPAKGGYYHFSLITK